MNIYLVGILKDITNKLRLNEEEYMKKYIELVGATSNSKFKENRFIANLDSSISHSSSSGKARKDSYGSNMLEFEGSDILRKRDVEINNLVNSITELAGIFKDLQALVFEQGNNKNLF